MPLYGTGNNVRDWIHVEDHCKGIELVLQRGRVGESYYFGGNCEMSNIDLTHKILTLMGRTETSIEYVQDRLGHDFRYAINTAKVERELGWKPQVNFDQGLQRTIDWYTTHTEWWEKLKVNSTALNRR